MSLKGKKALITGSSRGIGRGIALKLAQQGADVAVHYFQNEASASDVAARIRKSGGESLTVQADVCKPDEINRMFDHVKSKFGALDIFVGNARPELPVFYQAPMEITLEQWQAAIHSQATAFLVGVQAAAGFMRDGGRIIAVTYAAGSRTGSLQPWVGMGAAKAALEALVRYFAVTLAQRRITVNALTTSWTEDSVLNSLPQAAQDLIRNWHTRGWTPMRRLSTPADLGNAAALLCSEEAGWITGQLITADGGASLMNPEVPPELQLG